MIGILELLNEADLVDLRAAIGDAIEWDYEEVGDRGRVADAAQRIHEIVEAAYVRRRRVETDQARGAF